MKVLRSANRNGKQAAVIVKVLYLLLLPAVCSAAQSIEGTVLNSADDKGIAGVSVEILRAAKPVYSATTDARGGFVFKDVPSGAYTIRYSSPDYWPVRLPGVVSGQRGGPQPFQVPAVGSSVKLGGPPHDALGQLDGPSGIRPAEARECRGESSACVGGNRHRHHRRQWEVHDARASAAWRLYVDGKAADGPETARSGPSRRSRIGLDPNLLSGSRRFGGR